MTLDESIDQLAFELLEPAGGLVSSLRAFAAAISAKASEVQWEKLCPTCGKPRTLIGTVAYNCCGETRTCVHKEQPTTEPEQRVCFCGGEGGRITPELAASEADRLPKEVREKIIELYDFKCQRWDGYFKRDMEDFAHLCLSMRAK